MQRVLLADDENSLRQALSLIIRHAGYECVEAVDGVQAVEIARSERIDCAVLDVMMPELDGFEAVERIRAFDEDIPILMLSAKADIVDKKVGFRLGADDYMGKPFNEEEFILRIGALLRRRAGVVRKADEASGPDALAPASTTGGQADAPGTAGSEQRRIAIGDLVIDLVCRRAEVAGKPVPLTPREFDILATLASEPGRPFTSTELVELIWGADFTHDAISIPVYIRRLRKKIEEDPSDPVYIQTIHHVGYRVAAL